MEEALRKRRAIKEEIEARRAVRRRRAQEQQDDDDDDEDEDENDEDAGAGGTAVAAGGKGAEGVEGAEGKRGGGFLRHADRPRIHRSRRPKQPSRFPGTASSPRGLQSSSLSSLSTTPLPPLPAPLPAAFASFSSSAAEPVLVSPPAKADVSALRRESFSSKAYLKSAPLLLGTLTDDSSGDSSGDSPGYSSGDSPGDSPGDSTDDVTASPPPPSPSSPFPRSNADSDNNGGGGNNNKTRTTRQKLTPTTSPDVLPPPAPQSSTKPASSRARRRPPSGNGPPGMPPPPLPRAAPLPSHSSPFRAVQAAIQKGIIAPPPAGKEHGPAPASSSDSSDSDADAPPPPTLPPRCSTARTFAPRLTPRRQPLPSLSPPPTPPTPMITTSHRAATRATKTPISSKEQERIKELFGKQPRPQNDDENNNDDNSTITPGKHDDDDELRSDLERLRDEVAEIRMMTARREAEGESNTSRSSYAMDKMAAGAQLTARELRARGKILHAEGQKLGRLVVSRVDRAVAGPRGQAFKLTANDVRQQCVPWWCGGVRNLPSKQLGEAIFKRTIVLVWLHFVAGCVVMLLALSSLAGGLANSGRMNDSRFGVSLLFLLFCKFLSLLSVSGMMFRNIDTRACCYCCMSTELGMSGREGRRKRRGGGGGAGEGGRRGGRGVAKAAASMSSKWRHAIGTNGRGGGSGGSNGGGPDNEEQHESMLGPGATSSSGGAVGGGDFVSGGGILYEWGWLRCVIYLKVLDTAIGAWSALAMFRAMGLPSSVSSSASVATVLFFSFVSWVSLDVWGNVLLWTLARICNRWQSECWQSGSGPAIVEDGLRLRRDGRVIGEDESDDEAELFNNGRYEDGDMDLGNIATARGFGSNAYFSQEGTSQPAAARTAGGGMGFTIGTKAAPPAGHSANAMSVPRLNLRGVGSGGGAGGAFVPKLNFAAQTAAAAAGNHTARSAEADADVSLPPIMQALASAAGLDSARQHTSRASVKEDDGTAVQPASELHPTDFEQMWIDLPTTSSLTMELFVLPSPDAIKRFATARKFRVVASGMRGATFSVFLAARTARRSGGTCLFLAQLVFDAPNRALAATFKCEKRKYLQTFLEALALHQLDSFA